MHSFRRLVTMRNKGNTMIEEYISKIVGLRFSEKGSANELVKSLPQYLNGAFSFRFVEIEGKEFLLLTLSPGLDLSVSQTVKFANQIRKQAAKPTLLLFKSMDNIRRRTLINHKENFIVPNKQIYIPSLCMYLNESGNTQPFMANTSRLSFAIDKNVFTAYKDKLKPFLHPKEGNVCLEI